MREASGWKIADPTPISPTESGIAPKPSAFGKQDQAGDAGSHAGGQREIDRAAVGIQAY